VALSIRTGETTVGVVQQLEVEGLGEENYEAEEPDEVEEGADKPIEDDVAAVGEHHFEVDVPGGAHDEDGENEVEEDRVLGGAVEGLVADLVSRPCRGGSRG
jgi:hypothetical protein